MNEEAIDGDECLVIPLFSKKSVLESLQNLYIELESLSNLISNHETPASLYPSSTIETDE